MTRARNGLDGHPPGVLYSLLWRQQPSDAERVELFNCWLTFTGIKQRETEEVAHANPVRPIDESGIIGSTKL